MTGDRCDLLCLDLPKAEVHHLRALRAAGLVTSRRDGKLVMHAVTGAGRALLAAVHGDAELAR